VFRPIRTSQQVKRKETHSQENKEEVRSSINSRSNLRSNLVKDKELRKSAKQGVNVNTLFTNELRDKN